MNPSRWSVSRVRPCGWSQPGTSMRRVTVNVGGFDDGDLVAGLDRDQDLAGGVVGDVPGVPADVHGGYGLTGVRVENGFGATGFVGDPDLAGGGVVGESVGEVPGRCGGQHGAGVLVQGDDLVAGGGGGEHVEWGGQGAKSRRDDQEIIARAAALDVGEAEVM